MAYAIDKDIPIPYGHAPYDKFPFAAMEVGDSVFIHDKTVGALISATGRVRANLGYTFKRVTVTEDGARGFRIWRVG
jgi:hypothetical protein